MSNFNHRDVTDTINKIIIGWAAAGLPIKAL